MMLVLGMALYGSTVLLPLYLQVWMGYSAQDAGMALSPGGFVVILLLPIVGKLLGKVDARYLIAFGFLVTSAALLHMAHTLYPGIDFRTEVIKQAQTLAYLDVLLLLSIFTAIMIPAVLLTRKVKPGAAAMAH